jgi:hypothetical protein
MVVAVSAQLRCLIGNGGAVAGFPRISIGRCGCGRRPAAPSEARVALTVASPSGASTCATSSAPFKVTYSAQNAVLASSNAEQPAVPSVMGSYHWPGAEADKGSTNNLLKTIGGPGRTRTSNQTVMSGRL